MQTAVEIETLAWDSQHYGRKVARLRPRRLEPDALAAALERAQRDGVWLLYWLADVAQPVPAEWLQRYGGLRVVGHVRYQRALAESEGASLPDRAAPPIGEYRGEPEHEAEVVRLGIEAGALSRFRLDPRLPVERCDRMYEIWIRRSIAGELADVVLIARAGAAVAGLVTVSARGPLATIGLISTAAAQRGTGVGMALLAAAQRWADARGAERIEVVTQRENHAACRLYERAGYAAVEHGEHHHFLLAAAPAP